MEEGGPTPHRGRQRRWWPSREALTAAALAIVVTAALATLLSNQGPGRGTGHHSAAPVDNQPALSALSIPPNDPASADSASKQTGGTDGYVSRPRAQPRLGGAQD